MADQKRWFKVWTSILTDPSFLDLPLDQIGRWVLLGAILSLQGDKGKLTISKNALSQLLRCNEDETGDLVSLLPNVCVTHEKKCNEFDNDKVVVSFKNWRKYQRDSTSYDRVKRWREKQKKNADDNADKKKKKTKKKKRGDTPGKPCENSEAPHQEIIALYHKYCVANPKIKLNLWDSDRPGHKYLKTRWSEKKERQSLEWWENFFKIVSESDFLTGKTDAAFTPNLDWMVRPTNFIKIIEGNYKNREPNRESWRSRRYK